MPLLEERHVGSSDGGYRSVTQQRWRNLCRRRSHAHTSSSLAVRISTLCCSLRDLASTHLFLLQVLVQEIQGLLIGLWTASDGEHALASIIVRCLGNGNACSGALSDLADLAASTTNDATNHVGRDADVLRLNVLTLFHTWRRAAAAAAAFGCAIAARWVRCRSTAREVGTISSSVVAPWCIVSA